MTTTPDVDRDVLDVAPIEAGRVSVVGSKAASLAELRTIDGVRVPDGFCVTTGAFQRVIADAPSIGDRIGRLALLRPADRAAVGAACAEIRASIEAVAVPDELAEAIVAAVARLGIDVPCAVRSSATAEDLPTASFAGQHDTFLDVVGPQAILDHVPRCWASTFTERAVAYRSRHGIDHREVRMAVVVQRMVAADAAGVVFTADPVTSNRLVTTVEATSGPGEALVSGRVEPDVHRVRDGRIVSRSVGTEQVAVRAVAGGTEEAANDRAPRPQPVLTDAQVLRLAALGRRIEVHLGCPQDIEWCLAADDLHIVQSRPITTLFPVPERDDDAPHVYVSVGHQQMMTDPMTPLGLDVWRMTSLAPMHTAGGRLFVDVTERLASPAGRAGLLEVLGRGDPLIRDALETLLERGDLVPASPADDPAGPPPGGPPSTIETDPAIVTDLVARARASLDALERRIGATSGSAVFDLIREDVPEMRRVMFDPQSQQAVMAGMEATWWLDDRLQEWLGERGAADVLARSAPGNVTAQMGLALLDVADVIRPHAGVVAFLGEVDDDAFLDGGALAALEGGADARDAIRSYLAVHGVRGVGEIDIARPRWRDQPTALVPAILGDVRSFEPGEARRRFDRGRREAEAKAREVVERVRSLSDGERKADEVHRMVDRLRTFIGYREHPKHVMVSRYAAYRRAILREADELRHRQAIRDREDVFFLSFDELHRAVRDQVVDDDLIRRRRAAFAAQHSLTPPRVLTSEGEAVTGSYRRDDVPAGALVGLAVSAGTVEGRARVVLDVADADLETGDILVTAFTDPSWSPLFVALAGLVTEVGGLMTHGSVIAREYGLPAVVGVERATRLIEDGQRIRLHATDGYVEILDPT